MKNEKRKPWLRTTILVLAGCAVLGLILSAVLFLRNPGSTYAVSRMELTFDGGCLRYDDHTCKKLPDIVSDF